MKWSIAILCLLLLATNGFWFYHAIDQGVTNSYRDSQIYELRETNNQLMAMLPEVASHTPKPDLVTIAQKHTQLEAFEKDGCFWVGWLGFKFDSNNYLSYVSPIASYGEHNPCLTNP